MLRKTIILLMCFGIISCNPKKREIKKIIQEWQGKEIIIPNEEIIYKISGRKIEDADLWSKSYKIFTYIDSVGCTSCQMGLNQWKELIDSCRDQLIDISFLFVVHSSNFTEFEDELLLYEFDYPIIYDYENTFERLNRFPSTPYRTFLLDKENKVILIGSPKNNRKLWNLYKQEITRQTN